MIEVKDRYSRKPNRILISPESASGLTPFYATFTRADLPIEEGTPINKKLFDSIEEGMFLSTGTDDIEMCAMKAHTAAGITTITFDKPFSGIPKVFCSSSGMHLFSVTNVTRTGCDIAVYAPTTNTSGTTVTGFALTEADIDILAVYDGSVHV